VWRPRSSSHPAPTGLTGVPFRALGTRSSPDFQFSSSVTSLTRDPAHTPVDGAQPRETHHRHRWTLPLDDRARPGVVSRNPFLPVQWPYIRCSTRIVTSPRPLVLGQQACLHARVWSGEFHLELHRGTITSQVEIKQETRRSKNLVRDEKLWSAAARMAGRYPYLYEELEESWRYILLNRFHDILRSDQLPLRAGVRYTLSLQRRHRRGTGPDLGNEHSGRTEPSRHGTAGGQ
jgi:hypothetical protein